MGRYKMEVDNKEVEAVAVDSEQSVVVASGILTQTIVGINIREISAAGKMQRS